MIVLFTDFGLAGPYLGQMKAVLHRLAPAVPVVDLFADAPARDPRAAAYLLAAYAAWFPAGTVFLAVVDPGVGGERAALVVEADGCRYVGPDNGLFELVRRRARATSVAEITWRPAALSASFHGRDLFAPVAARLAAGEASQAEERPSDFGRRRDWPDDLAEIVYIDHYGNALTGLRAALLPANARLVVGDQHFRRARTFSDVAAGQALWYENSNGLAEIAVNLGRADVALGLGIGSRIGIES
ncbi:MAG TPA: SAM-dependent chlorinase/fluorinase [Stellaceae bacterium]|nr:SAM-dependent chlorinase/fluorinase [Stellaceae bacterium]